MGPNWYLTVAAAVFGAVVGCLILLGWLITRWMLGEVGHPRLRVPLPRTLAARRWVVRIAAAVMAVASTTAGFAYLVYPSPQPAPTPAPALETAALRPPPAPTPTPMPQAPPPTRIEVGGIAILFEPPAGYCLYPPELLQAVLATQRKANPDNAVHIAFGDCDQLHNRGNDGARIRDFGLLMTPKAMLAKTVGKSVLAQYARETLDQRELQRGADRGIQAAERKLEINSFASAGVLARTDGAIYFGFLSRIKSGGAGSFEQAGLMAMTVIHGRLIAYYLYADFRSDPRPAFARLQPTAKAGVERMAALNR
ncbi:MAG TPA: hypothetical protein VMG55_01880 [Stellaceae bacterium]|nr:hypothetical protein [Stellaceae bacterium]